MKTLKKQISPIPLLLAFVMLFQGCTVYKSASVTLEEAVRADTKVKLKTKNDQTLKFNKLGVEEGMYFGVKEIYKDDAFNISKKEIIKTPIDVNNIEVIKIKNKTMSTILPFAIPVTLFAILLGSAAIWY